MHRQRLILGGSLVIALVATTTACACLWDSDTLQMERLRFPGVLEIITGKFVRHSRAYYEWRIKDRLKKLEAKPDDRALIDDLAVGYDKLGRYDEGIAVLEKSLAADPNRYETLANLATLLFHAGRLEESKKHVERALEINPNAHFGREKYQLLLTEYVLQSELKKTGVLNSSERSTGLDNQGFSKFVIDAYAARIDKAKPEPYSMEWQRQEMDEVHAATKGVLGMMHFASFESPILLEALGDLLVTRWPDDMTQLAARAYLRAAQLSKDPNAAVIYENMARSVLVMHEDYGMHSRGDFLPKLERELAAEMVEADKWFAEIEANERAWIAANKDVDREFAAVYYDSLDKTLASAEEQLDGEWQYHRRPYYDRVIFLVIGLVCLAPIGAALGGGLIFWIVRRRRAKAKAKPPERIGAATH